MGKTSRRGEVEDREAEEEDSGSWAYGKMGQSFIIIPETICRVFFKFHFEVFLTFNDCESFFNVLPPQTSVRMA